MRQMLNASVKKAHLEHTWRSHGGRAPEAEPIWQALTDFLITIPKRVSCSIWFPVFVRLWKHDYTKQPR